MMPYLCGDGYGVGGYGMMGFGFGWLFTVIIWILIIWAIVSLVRHGGWHGHGEAKKDAAMEILKQRYAKGEISKEEFEAKKKDIMG